ncbi:hypothetical protein GBA52_006571 [Prunus armeniaca]|nr:hypothetical protein GBA52_006571 [Prunus armeniaca]
MREVDIKSIIKDEPLFLSIYSHKNYGNTGAGVFEYSRHAITHVNDYAKKAHYKTYLGPKCKSCINLSTI